MHQELIEKLKLICPRCRCPEVQSSLTLRQVFKKDRDFILEGFLVCSFENCQKVYPILKGVPIILKDIEKWWGSEKSKFSCVVSDAPEMREYFDALSKPAQHAERCLLSTYMDLHYGSLDDVPPAFGSLSDPNAFWKILVEIARPKPDTKYQRSLDLGCSVGRYTFELARFSELTIGIDLNFNAVSSAAEIQRTKKVRYERRKRGSCFEEIQIPFSPPQNVLFLVGDALDPPFAAESFDLVAGLNLLDNVKLPLVLIGQMDALLRRGGDLILCSPYEWRADICEPTEWLENDSLDAPAMVRNILEGNFFPQMGLKYQILQELSDVPWVLRHHVRYWSLFFVHPIKARKLP